MTTSRGDLLERLFQVGTLECTISHDVEALQFCVAELEEYENAIEIVKIDEDEALEKELKGKIDKIQFQIEKRKEIISDTISLRRSLMKTLDGLGDRDWCSCKHYSEAVQRALEIYATTYSDTDYELLIETYRIWAARLSLYFNLPYTTCFRCLNDKLKGK